MTEPQLYWHVHHDKLVERLTEPIENRLRYIRECKSKDEIELRLRLLKPVKDRALRSALAEYEKVRGQALAEYEKVTGPALAEYEELANRIHTVECPSCSWNGETIFP